MDVRPVTPVPLSTGSEPTGNRHGDTASHAQAENNSTEKKSRFEAVAVNGNEIVYRAVDPETGILLAEVPSEEVRQVAKKLTEMIAHGKIK